MSRVRFPLTVGASRSGPLLETWGRRTRAPPVASGRPRVHTGAEQFLDLTTARLNVWARAGLGRMRTQRLMLRQWPQTRPLPSRFERPSGVRTQTLRLVALRRDISKMNDLLSLPAVSSQGLLLTTPHQPFPPLPTPFLFRSNCSVSQLVTSCDTCAAALLQHGGAPPPRRAE